MAKTCFIVMPITTPSNYAELTQDSEHFYHVLKCLHVPAVEKAGFEAIEPITDGSDIIHSRIIKNLESSDMVLCDISSLNANVFYEFGIRTALNKPLCLIKDNLTEKIPFDATIINCLTYDYKLRPWSNDDTITTLATSIQQSEKRCGGENPFWKLLGFKIASQSQNEEPKGAELKALSLENEILKEKIENNNRNIPRTAKIEYGHVITCPICGFAFEYEGYNPHVVSSRRYDTVTSAFQASQLFGIPQSRYVKCPKCGTIKTISDGGLGLL